MLTLFGELMDTFFQLASPRLLTQLGSSRLFHRRWRRLFFGFRLRRSCFLFGFFVFVLFDHPNLQPRSGRRLLLSFFLLSSGFRLFGRLTFGLCALNLGFLIAVNHGQFELTESCAHSVEGMLIQRCCMRCYFDSRLLQHCHHLVRRSGILFCNLVYAYCH